MDDLSSIFLYFHIHIFIFLIIFFPPLSSSMVRLSWEMESRAEPHRHKNQSSDGLSNKITLTGTENRNKQPPAHVLNIGIALPAKHR